MNYIKISGESSKSIEEIGVALIKGDYRVIDFTVSQQYGESKTTKITVLTSKAEEINLEFRGG